MSRADNGSHEFQKAIERLQTPGVAEMVVALSGIRGPVFSGETVTNRDLRPVIIERVGEASGRPAGAIIETRDAKIIVAEDTRKPDPVNFGA